MADADFAKTHLKDHLATLIIPPVSDGFWSVYSTAKDLCIRNEQPDQILRTFQNMLTKIPEWSDSTLSTEVERISKTSKCTYLDDLLMGVFISYMKSFAAMHYRGDSSHVSVDFDRPSFNKFIHELYIQSARKIWQVAYLFKTIGVSNEVQARNRQEIVKIIHECMEVVIRSFLPWESIAKQFADTSAVPPSYTEEKSNRKVVFAEEDEEQEFETEDDDAESQDSGPATLQISDDNASIDIETLDDEKVEEIDPLKEIESKMSSELVLKL